MVGEIGHRRAVRRGAIFQLERVIAGDRVSDRRGQFTRKAAIAIGTDQSERQTGLRPVMHLRLPKLAVEAGGAAMNDKGGVGVLLFQLIGLAVQSEAAAMTDAADIAADQRAVEVAGFFVSGKVV